MAIATSVLNAGGVCDEPADDGGDGARRSGGERMASSGTCGDIASTVRSLDDEGRAVLDQTYNAGTLPRSIFLSRPRNLTQVKIPGTVHAEPARSATPASVRSPVRFSMDGHRDFYLREVAWA